MRDDYVQRLGLERDPFPGHPDGLFLNTTGITQRIGLLGQLLQSSTRPILIVAPHGGGITTFAAVATNALGAPFQCVTWRATARATSAEVLKALARALGAADTTDDMGSAELGDIVRAQLVKSQATNSLPVLVVDDAHQLPQPALETLLELGDTTAGWLRLVFAGEPKTEKLVLRARASRQPNWLSLITLQPLTLAETSDYLRVRLLEAGWNGDSPFDADATAALYARAGGHPSRLSELAGEALESRVPAPTGVGYPWWKSRRMAIAGGSGLALVLLAFIVLTWTSGNVEETPAVSSFELPQSVLGTTPQAGSGNAQTAPAPPPASAVPDPVEGPPPPNRTAELPLPKPNSPAATVPTVQGAATVAASTSNANPRKPPPRPAPPPRPRTVSPVAVPAPTPRSTLAPTPAPPTPQIVSAAFGIQLGAFADRTAANAYIVAHNLAGKTRIYRLNRTDSSPVFAVIYGQYDTREEASGAVITLPLNLRASGPWSRSLEAMIPLP